MIFGDCGSKGRGRGKTLLGRADDVSWTDQQKRMQIYDLLFLIFRNKNNDFDDNKNH